MRFNEIEIGKVITFEKVITSQMVADFAKVSGDHNKVHLDEDYARNTVFKRRIAHGFLYGSLISMVLGTIYPGPGTVYLSQEMKFLFPVYIDDKLSVNLTVLEKNEKNKVKLKTDIYNQNNKLVLNGTAVVSIPS